MLGVILVAGLLWFVVPGLVLWLAWRLRRKPRPAPVPTEATRDSATS